MDSETRQKLEKEIKTGNHASSALFIIDTIGNDLIEEIKEEFVRMPVKCYQSIDNNPFIVLQLKVEAVKDFQKLVKAYIKKGLEASKKLHGVIEDE